MEGIEVPFVDGKVNGKSIRYYSSGAIKGEIPYVNGEAWKWDFLPKRRIQDVCNTLR